jgi:hypothetical protein
MSYLDSPRLHFSGFFQADVSTINNDVRYYDVEKFQPQYQSLSLGEGGGSWNPTGTGVFRFVNCQITGAALHGKTLYVQSQDPVIGMSLQNADDRAPGKLVDLDPQQQAVSEIWGMQVRLTNGRFRALFEGDFLHAAFINLWQRQQSGVLADQKLAACYGSVLENVQWNGDADSPVLDALAKATEQGLLAIEFNVFGYGRDPTIPRYTLGHIVGTIAPYHRTEPRHFAVGRQIAAPLPADNPTAPAHGVYSFTCKVDSARQVVTADFGNSLPIIDANRGLVDIGTLLLGVLKQNPTAQLTSVHLNDFVNLGQVLYHQTGWYRQTAGIQEFPYGSRDGASAIIDDHAIVLLRPRTGDTYDVLVQESLGGVYVRADGYVLRLEPGETGGVDFYASQYGHPLAGAAISVAANNDMIGGSGAGNNPLDPPVVIPDVGIPADGIQYAATVTTGADGKVRLPIASRPGGPGRPRGYIEGQVYGIGYQLTDQPAGYSVNAWNFISVLAYSHTDMTSHITWYREIEPIFKQFGNLYPIMSKHLVDLGNYDSVVEHRAILKLAFSLPRTDPNHMPVTRDMSISMRDMILKWLDGPMAKGSPAPRTVARPIAVAAPGPAVKLEPLQAQGKSAFLLETQARLGQRGRKP